MSHHLLRMSLPLEENKNYDFHDILQHFICKSGYGKSITKLWSLAHYSQINIDIDINKVIILNNMFM